MFIIEEAEYQYSGSEDEENGVLLPGGASRDSLNNNHSRNNNNNALCHAEHRNPIIPPISIQNLTQIPMQDDTLRKGFQRIQESNRNAFEHAGAQPLKRVAAAPTDKQRHAHSKSGESPHRKPSSGNSGGVYHRSAAPYSAQQSDPVKMRGPNSQNSRGGPIVSQLSSAARPLSHHQAMPQPIRSNVPLTSSHHHMSASPQSAGDYERKRREEKHRVAHRDHSRGANNHRNGHNQSNVSPHHNHHHHQAASIVPQAHLARVNASIATAVTPMRKVSTDPLLINGAAGACNRPEVFFVFYFLFLNLYVCIFYFCFKFFLAFE